MTAYLRRAIAGSVLLAGGFAGRNRRRLGWAAGVRVLVIHAEDTDDFDGFRRWIDWFGGRMPWAAPDAVDDGARLGGRDSLLLTMDDGHARTFKAVTWLASVGVRMTYFVIPSYVGRSLQEYFAYHASRGVAAFDIGSGRDRTATRGFDVSQLKELEHMGHRIGAHNNAHRDLHLLGAEGAQYEVAGAIDGLSELLDHRVDDFAWAFGTMGSLSPEALALMRGRCRRLYSSVRGLNVPQVTPAVILRDPVSVRYPRVFNVACVRGALDHRYEPARHELLRLTGCMSAAA